jgi:hypothetical protein
MHGCAVRKWLEESALQSASYRNNMANGSAHCTDSPAEGWLILPVTSGRALDEQALRSKHVGHLGGAFKSRHCNLLPASPSQPR